MAEVIIKPLDIGVFLHSLAVYDIVNDNLQEAITVAGQNGLNIIQLGPVNDAWLGNEAKQDKLVDILNNNKVKVGPLCVCYESGKGRGGLERYDNIDKIAETGGYGYQGEDQQRIVAERIQLTKDHIDLARYLRRQSVMSSKRAVLTTHVGFFGRTEKREQIKEAVKEVLKYCKRRVVYLAIETGSEKMQDLVKFIKEVEVETGIEGRLGINYDPANFYLYGTQDPLGALKVLNEGDNKKYLFGVHIKDADVGQTRLRAEGDWKGREVPVGSGSVQWHKTMVTLYELGYRGPLIIEREGPPPRGIQGSKFTELRISDVLHAKHNIEIAQREALLSKQQRYVPFG